HLRPGRGGHGRGGDGRLLRRMTQPPIRPDGATEMVRRTVPPGRRMRRTAAPWLLLSPALVLLAVLLLLAQIGVLNLTLPDYQLSNVQQGTNDYIGLDNYVHVLTAPCLGTTVLPATVGFALVCVTLTLIVGTVVALFLTTLGATLRVL